MFHERNQEDAINPRTSRDFVEWCGVSQKTAERYQSGEAKIPKACLGILSIVRDGILPFPELDKIRVGPEGIFLPGWSRPFSPDELRAHFWRVQQLEELRRTVRKLRKKGKVEEEEDEIEVVILRKGKEIKRLYVDHPMNKRNQISMATA